MRTVFASASGKSSNTAAISSAVFRKNWSPWYFSRFGVADGLAGADAEQDVVRM